VPRSPLQAERSGDGKGEAKRRAAQAEQSAARKPGKTRCAREGRRPLAGRGVAGWGTAPLGWVVEDAGTIVGWSDGKISFPLNVTRVFGLQSLCLQNLHTPSQFCTGSQAIPWLGYSQAGARYYMLVLDSIEQERWYAVVELAQIVGGQRTW